MQTATVWTWPCGNGWLAGPSALALEFVSVDLRTRAWGGLTQPEHHTGAADAAERSRNTDDRTNCTGPSQIYPSRNGDRSKKSAPIAARCQRAETSENSEMEMPRRDPSGEMPACQRASRDASVGLEMASSVARCQHPSERLWPIAGKSRLKTLKRWYRTKSVGNMSRVRVCRCLSWTVACGQCHWLMQPGMSRAVAMGVYVTPRRPPSVFIEQHEMLKQHRSHIEVSTLPAGWSRLARRLLRSRRLMRVVGLW